MYVATLTMYEVVYGGGTLRNKNTYLINNWQQDGYYTWWTLTPQGYHLLSANSERGYQGDQITQGYFVESSGLEFLMVNDAHIARPSISLISTSTLTTKQDTVANGEPGTINNPYVIN